MHFFTINLKLYYPNGELYKDFKVSERAITNALSEEEGINLINHLNNILEDETGWKPYLEKMELQNDI